MTEEEAGASAAVRKALREQVRVREEEARDLFARVSYTEEGIVELVNLIAENRRLGRVEGELTQKLNDLLAKEQTLLQCVDCRNTESPAGAMARHFNQGRCLHCGGFFKVVRA